MLSLQRFYFRGSCLLARTLLSPWRVRALFVCWKFFFYICTMMDNTKIKFVEEEVMKTYNITRDELMSYDKHKNICMARMMCIYILHNDFGISSNYLSKRYNRSRRVIFSICQKMKAITKTYIKDKELYTHLKEVVFSIWILFHCFALVFSLLTKQALRCDNAGLSS